MEAERGTIDLERLSLAPGQATRVELELPIDPVRLGDTSYEPGLEATPARVELSRTTGGGYALRLVMDAELAGPCVRCLEEARPRLKIDAREVDQPASGDEELRSPYVADGKLDAAHWANDAVVLALPAQPLCRPDCAGLCPVCGESLNDAEPGVHDHPRDGDPRMAKLRDLKLD
jgi:uncharacterized protein